MSHFKSRLAAYPTGSRFAYTLGPIALSLDSGAGSFRDYLTVDEASALAGELLKAVAAVTGHRGCECCDPFPLTEKAA
jgi:hypothetical protein